MISHRAAQQARGGTWWVRWCTIGGVTDWTGDCGTGQRGHTLTCLDPGGLHHLDPFAVLPGLPCCPPIVLGREVFPSLGRGGFQRVRLGQCGTAHSCLSVVLELRCLRGRVEEEDCSEDDREQNVLPQNMSFGHIHYFRLVTFKKKQTQEKL